MAFCAYFAAMLVLAFMVAPLSPGLSWGMSAAEIAHNAGLGDPRSFITGALDISRHGWVTGPNYWLLRLWPPGFMSLEGALLRMLGEGAPILLPLLAASAFCCAIWLSLLRQFLLPLVPPRAASLAPLVPFLFPLTSFFMLGPVGLILGETFAVSFFITGFLLVLLAWRHDSLWLAMGSGLSLAASAYFRSQFELLVTFLTAGALIVCAVAGGQKILRRGRLLQRASVATMLVAVITAQLAMAPWRYHNYLDSQKPVWVHTSDLIARNSLTKERELLSLGGEFVVRGGGHLACKFEPTYCGKYEPRLFYDAFFQHMGRWVMEKARLLPEYWLAPPAVNALSGVRVDPTSFQVLANIVFLMAILAGLWALWRIRRQPLFAVTAWFVLSYYASLAGIYTLAHFEARYFYLPKIFGTVVLLVLLAALASPVPRTRSRSAA